ncbi:TetR/AcrR family transcriptional regulator [Schnuerera sp.]|uniref:TetR/AcrR family transcriptional regulator n=1 Tax=Schnuerera sp. TaxID=2794844 RepID=UPI002D0A392F|nr:TetR/AcrR family transcriptional regulator [Schnuerera sp.]HSH35101.1 TetR/AcrR family transcriptional regulator [Schnuerera sp.]
MTENKEKLFEKREELINVAMNEFGKKGYENASLNNILREVGISKGTFYYHYKNKEDLYMHLMDIITEEKLKFISDRMDLIDFDEDVFTVLRNLMKIGMKFANKNPNISKFTQSFVKDLGTPIHNEIFRRYLVSRTDYLNNITKEYGFESMDYISNLIEKAYERGEIREDLPIEFVRNIINHLFINLPQIVNSANLDEYELAVNYLIDFIKNGLMKD